MLLPAISRALHTIYLDRPRLKAARLSLPIYHGRMIAPMISHAGGEVISEALDGIAYSFRVSGRGRYTITSGALREEVDFDTDMAEIKGIITRPGKITFSGDYSYTVYSLAVFSAINSPKKEDIPIYGEERSIDLNKRLPDFLGPYALPTDSAGRSIHGARITDGVLYMPWGYFGEAILLYKRAPRVPSGEDKEELIDLPRDIEELIPLLVASYLWLDDDEGKAHYYMSLYKSGIIEARAAGSLELGRGYTTNGWA